MKNILIALSILCNYASFSQTKAYDQAWLAINQNKKSEAVELLTQAMSDPSTYEDAYITNLYLKTYNGKEKEITDFTKSFYQKAKDPYPYVYSLWFNAALLGDYGKKIYEHQLKLIDQIINDDKAPGTLVSAANYQKGMDALFSANFSKAQQYYNAVGNIKNWQYTGPFENLSQSGINKSYGPYEHPEPEAIFKTITNADVKWFTPPAEITDGWTPMCYGFNRQTAVIYAQNFVTSAVDQTVYFNAGISGSAKVWINDELVISEPKERVTEMDAYTVKVDLKKGINRVLVQLGFTANSYPNFCIRFTDNKYKPLSNITGSSTYSAYSKNTNSNKKFPLVAQFAESYFKDKITANPGNFVNYLLLADVYLRNKRVLEARDLITAAMQKAPDNFLLRFKLIEILIKENNRTMLLEEIEKMKQSDPECIVVLELNIKEFFNNEKYEDGAKELEKRIKLFGEDESTYAYQIMILVHDKKYDDLVKAAEKMYAKFPDNSKMLELMYGIKKDVYKDVKGAFKVYENYMKDNFQYDVYNKYADLLSEAGKNDKSVEVRKKIADIFPYSPLEFFDLSAYYFSAKQFDKAEEQIRKALALSPYNEKYWEQLGDIKNEKNNTHDALEAYNQSLKYDPNQYDIINKIRKLNSKSELAKLFNEIDIQKIIKDDKPAEARNTDYGYYYILDQKDVIIYPGGANEEYFTTILKITNNKGVDRYKESTIPYTNSQNLLIEKAEVIKKNQAKIDGERNGNQVVFSNLEAGDIIVFKYRLQSYVYGRLAKEYWDKYYFNGQIYSAITRYNLLMPAEQKLNYIFTISNVQPVIKDVENFKQYSWEVLNPVPLKDEPYMPVVADVCAMLHVSTIPSWADISNWYSDISNNKAEEDFEIIDLYKSLFPEGQKSLSQFQKAKVIYNYIESNIRYSSVSFRQSAFVPQSPATTLSTRLGDCKDLSSLFVTLAHMAGINAQMVLVDTRDNGEKQIALPSVDFNHCIAKATLDNKTYFIELTDNDLPFVSLPNNLNGAAILEIPSSTNTGRPGLQFLKSDTRTKDVVKRVVDIRPGETDISVNVETVKYGNLSSGIRNNYRELDNAKQMQNMEKEIANGYKNNVKLEQVNFKGLDKLEDSVTFTYSYKVKNEIAQIGSLKTFRIVYPDIVASLDNFSADTRDYGIEYWKYEDADNYETTVNITAPAGKKFVELPTSQTLSFKDMKYSLVYTLKAPDKLVVTRHFMDNRQNIVAADYAGFKAFFEKIVVAEQTFIAYK